MLNKVIDTYLTDGMNYLSGDFDSFEKYLQLVALLIVRLFDVFLWYFHAYVKLIVVKELG